MEIRENISLLSYNSLRVDAKAKYFVEIDSVETLQEFVKTEVFLENKFFVLGGGCNVLFVDDFDGVVLKNSVLGKEIVFEDEESVLIKVGGGENWPKFVQWTVDNNFLGVENLAFIPGSVGASPVQNIGAYGAEAKNAIYQVCGVALGDFEFDYPKDENTGEYILEKSDCKLAYRDSIFKQELKDKFLVTSVVFKLKKWKAGVEGQFNLTYAGLVKAMEQMGLTEKNLTPKKIAEIIIEIRKSKLPDREQIGTAGSFFKNPVVSVEKYEEMKDINPDLVGFEVEMMESNPPQPPFIKGGVSSNSRMIKLSAGQLLQVCGRKGKKEGSVGTYHNHALVLVNYGGGSGKEIVEFARTLQECVWDSYGVELEPEVVFVS